jgi:O-antigen/teichoic acid export membrane protein
MTFPFERVPGAIPREKAQRNLPSRHAGSQPRRVLAWLFTTVKHKYCPSMKSLSVSALLRNAREVMFRHLPAGRRSPTLSHRVLSAGGWTLFGYGLNQCMRFGSNLLLTRLLFPEAFGLMAIAQAVLIGTAMLSDVGIEQFIVQNKHGQTRQVVDAAYTVQALRGLAIWLVCCILAIPFSVFYERTELAWLLPALSLSALIGGLASVNIATASRSLKLSTITALEFATTFVSLASMIFLAWLTHSIWSLVVGNLIGSATRTLASHIIVEGERNRFTWNLQAFHAIGSFGRWIFLSTAATFLVGEGNRLLIGSFLDVKELAFYSLATALVLLPLQIFQQIGSRVLFPAFSELTRDRPERLAGAVKRARIISLIPYGAIGLAFALLGERLISVLYDQRYAPAGWMLTILAIGMFPQAAVVSYGPVLWALGKVRTSALLVFVQLALQIIAMSAGLYLGGPKGLLLGLGLASWLLYPFYATVYARSAIWQPRVDLPFLTASFVLSALVLYRF